MQKTPAFWEKYVLPKLDRDFAGLHQFLNDPYPSGPNYYLDRIEANIDLSCARRTVGTCCQRRSRNRLRGS